MGVLDYMKNAAMSFMGPGKKRNMNPAKPEAYPTYHDLNKDGEDPVLRPKKVNISPPQEALGYNYKYNKHGHYVSTLNYPLPPLSWERKQFEKNRRMRNAKNRYL